MFSMIVKYAPFVSKVAGDEYSFIIKCVILNNKEKTEKNSHQRCKKKKRKTDAQLQRQMEVLLEKK